MSTTILQNRIPLGITLPIRNGGIGFFEQTYDTFSKVKTNIINLLRTKPGERRMQPTFGCRLYNVVFEQNTDILHDQITNIVKEDVSNWIPDVNINEVDVKLLKNEEENNIDIYKVYININFTVTTIKQSGNIEIIINTN